MPCVHVMERHARLHSGREPISELWAHHLPLSAIALTLLSRQKTILRAACEGGVAHVLVHIMRQEGCGRGG